MFASKRHQIADADVYSVGVGAQILRDQIRRETIKAGWNRRVRSQEIARTSRRERNFERLPSLHHKSARASQHRERRRFGTYRQKRSDRSWSPLIHVGRPRLERCCGYFEGKSDEDERRRD